MQQKRKHTIDSENRVDEEKLAAHVIETWDMDDLVTYAIDRLTHIYESYTDEELAKEAEAADYREED